MKKCPQPQWPGASHKTTRYAHCGAGGIKSELCLRTCTRNCHERRPEKVVSVGQPGDQQAVWPGLRRVWLGLRAGLVPGEQVLRRASREPRDVPEPELRGVPELRDARELVQRGEPELQGVWPELRDALARVLQDGLVPELRAVRELARVVPELRGVWPEQRVVPGLRGASPGSA